MKKTACVGAFVIGLGLSSLAIAEEVTAIADLERGTTVTVAGTVDRILDEDEFRLTDATGSIDVYIGPNRVPAEVGEAVTVRGLVDDGLFIDIYADEMVRADGSVIRFDRRYE